MVDIYKGVIKASLLEAFNQSSEKDVKVHRKPELKVTVTKDIPVAGLTLAAFTRAVLLLKDKNGKVIAPPPSSVSLGEMFKFEGEACRAYLRPALAFPKSQQQSMGRVADPCFCAYWAAMTTEDAEAANCKKDVKVVQASCGVSVYSIEVPVYVNTSALKAGDELLIHSRKRTAPIGQHEGEPDDKKGKSEKEEGTKGKAEEGEGTKGKTEEEEGTGKDAGGKGKPSKGKAKQGRGKGKAKK